MFGPELINFLCYFTHIYKTEKNSRGRLKEMGTHSAGVTVHALDSRLCDDENLFQKLKHAL